MVKGRLDRHSMEESQNPFEWWWAHRSVLASFVLLLASLLTNAFPLFAQRRLPKLSLTEVIRRHPKLRWLRRGGSLASWGSYVLVALGFFFLQLFDNRETRRLSDERGLFLGAVILCIPSLSAGILALRTGIYREIVGRGEPAGKYYCVAGTGLSWVPLAHFIAALTVAALSLTGFFTTAPR
jgi:hypothetical protein